MVRAQKGGAFGHVRVLGREQADAGHEVAVAGPHGAAEGLAFDVIEIDMSREISPTRDAAALAALGAAYRRFRPDVIHAHGSKGGVLARLARPGAGRAPLIYTPHQFAFVNYFAGARQQARYRRIERALVPLTSRYLCVCEAERQLALELGAGDRARTVHNGIAPLEPGPPPPELVGLARDAPLIAVVAELHERKGVVTLLEAMPAILEAHPDAHVAIAGEGPERPELERRIAAGGLSDRVLLLGHVDGVSGLLSAATIFVNPAWGEAFPYAILEAMSLGLPAVVTDTGGSAEAVTDGVHGAVVPVADAGALAGAIGDLLGAGPELEAMGERARQRALREFSLDRMLAGTVAVYAEVGIT